MAATTFANTTNELFRGAVNMQYYQIDLANNLWAGDPNVGFNRDLIAISVNLHYITNNQFAHARLYVFDKTNYYAGGTSYTLIDLDPTAGSSIVPAVTYSTNVDKLYLLQNHNGNTNINGVTNGLLRIYTLQKTSTNLTALTNFPSCPKTWAFQPPGGMNFAPQLGVTNKFQTGDARVQNVVYRNGWLWCAQTVFYPATAPTRCAIQWWQISTNGTPQQVGQLDDSSGTNFYAYPSIAVNRFNDVLIGYNHFASNQYASADYSFRAYSDQSGTLQAGQILKAGESSYFDTTNNVLTNNLADNGSNNFWGNYTASTVDPTNDIDFWTFQAYPATNSLGQSNNYWATWAERIVPPGPANDNFAGAITLSGASGSLGGTNIRATAESSEPVHVGVGVGASVWYKWTPTDTANAEIDTMDATNNIFNTVLAVYTGSAVTNLTCIASNDDFYGHDSLPTNKNSLVSFTATNGTTYWVAVDGKPDVNKGSTGMGSFTLHWIQPSAPYVYAPPQQFNVLAGTNVTFSVSSLGIAPLSFQWQWEGANIAGATNSTYTKSNVQTNDAGGYSVVVTNAYGSTSAAGHLQVYDTATPTLSAETQIGTNFQFTVTGVTNSYYVVDVSTNLVDWTTIVTDHVTFNYTNTAMTNPYQFYRSRYHP